jgi:hypothetical protein
MEGALMFFELNEKPITEIQIELTDSDIPHFGGVLTLEIPTSVEDINTLHLVGSKKDFKKLAFLINEALDKDFTKRYEFDYKSED